MTSMAANDADGAGGMLPCMVNMTVLDLAIFMRVHRTTRVAFAGDVSATIGQWFDCEIDPRAIEAGFRRMIEKGWLVTRDLGVRPSVVGRRHGRMHLRGLIRMMDQGTKMLDVARMMSVLNLAMSELDGEHPDDEDE